MAWVKSEYAGELAVLSTWLVGIAPWSVSLFGGGQFTGIVFRFLPLRLQYLLGVTLPEEVEALTFLWAWEVTGAELGNSALVGALGLVALAVFALTFTLSLYYYFEEERVGEVLPVDPVRLFGAALGFVGVTTMAATLLSVRYYPGTTIPIGSLFALVFAYILLTVDRT